MNTLQDKRRLAAAAAAGISGEPIYTAAIRVMGGGGISGKVLDLGAGTGGFAKLLEHSKLYSEVHAADLIDYGNRESDNIK